MATNATEIAGQLAAGKKTGDTYVGQDGATYTITGPITAQLVTPAPSIANSGTPTQLDPGKTTAQRLQDERNQLITANNAGTTTADARAKNTERIQAIDKDLETLGKPAVVGKGSSVITGYDANGKPIMSDQTAFPLPAGASVAQIGPDGKPTFTQAPPRAPVDSPAATTMAQAALTNADSARIMDQAKLLQDKYGNDTAAAKAAFDVWFKATYEEPRAEQTQAISAQTMADTEGNNAATRAMEQAKLAEGPGAGDLYAQVANKFGGMNVTRDAFARPLPDMNGIARAATLQALKDVSPTAQSIYGAGAGGLTVPKPTVLPGQTPSPDIAAPAAALAAPPVVPAAAPTGPPPGVDPIQWAAFQKFQQQPQPAAA